MTGRSALITGGSSGIGLAIAEALVADGFGVTIVARNQDRLDTAASALRAAGGQVTAVAADLVRDDSVERVVRAHLAAHGGLAVLVNNAGTGRVGAIADQSARALDLQITLNLRSAYRLMQLCVPPLRECAAAQGASYVINVSSVTARECPPFSGAYAATKAALIALSNSAHAELSRAGVHVTALVPGFVDTPGTSWVDPPVHEHMISAVDVAEAVRFVLRTSHRCFVPEIVLTTAGPGVLRSPVNWEELAASRRKGERS